MNKHSVVVSLCVFGMLFPPPKIYGADANKTLKEAVNSKSFILVNPAESWPYPGGLLVIPPKAKSATFIDLPKSVTRPDTAPASAAFLAQSKQKKFTIGAILTGLASIITGNPGGVFGHSSNSKVDQINSTGSKIIYDDARNLIRGDAVQGRVLQWLHVPGQQVMVVAVVLNTKKISVSTDSSTNLDLAFNGSSVSKCSQTSEASNSATSSPGKDSANSDSGGSKTNTSTNDKGTSGSSSVAKDKASQPSAAGANSSTADSQTKSPSTTPSLPGGELHVCLSGNSSVTLDSDQPLVFAVAAYRAQIVNTNGKEEVDLQPAYSLTPGGEAESNEVKRKCPAGQDPNECAVSVKVAATVPSHWTKVAWGEPIK